MYGVWAYTDCKIFLNNEKEIDDKMIQYFKK